LRSWFWALFLPLLAIACILPTQGFSILLLFMAYASLVYRVYRFTLKRGYQSTDAILYGLFCVLEKFPKLQGQIKFHISQFFNQKRTILEYKSSTSTST
jgi:hypothetical protein